MSKVFRAKFVAILRQSIEKQSIKLPNEYPIYKQLFQNKWVVYAKRPFGSPKSVLEYLGRYSHKIAISNHRILNIENGNVHFSYKDYRKNGEKKVLVLAESEFIRRFALHILPSGFMRIRHYGILSSGHKKRYLKVARYSLKAQGKVLPKCSKSGQSWEAIAKDRLNFDVKKCTCCGQQTMVQVGIIPAQMVQKATVIKKERAPPMPRIPFDQVQF
jgi:hypothetical protein